jgi:hypothetical protein
VADIKALTATQVCALSADQHAALSAAQLAVLPLGSPLLLDLDGNGIRTLSVEAGVRFDLFGDGAPLQTGWVGPGDGLLAFDRNGDGIINDGGELFGTATTLPDGSTASDGFAALAALDQDGNGRIDAADPAFGQLRVWVDANADGISQAAELLTLQQAGVAALGVQGQRSNATDNGNWIGMAGSYRAADGSTHALDDVWFVVDRTTLAERSSALAGAIATYAPLAPAAPAAPLADLPAAPLAQQVQALAQQISQFNVLPPQAAVELPLGRRLALQESTPLFAIKPG